MKDIEWALEMAIDAHRNQEDKAGEAYIKHPLRVMQSVESEDEKIVALLHDVVEDSDIGLEQVEDHFSNRAVVNAVEALTKRSGESYSEFIDRCKSNDLARSVKIADIRDNLDVTRLDSLSDEDFERIKKYSRSLEELEEGL